MIYFILLLQAIDTQQQGKYKVKVVSAVINADDDQVHLKNIPLISTLHDFEFTENGLTVWRAFCVGDGNLG